MRIYIHELCDLVAIATVFSAIVGAVVSGIWVFVRRNMPKPNEPNKGPTVSWLRRAVIKSSYVVLLFATVGVIARLFVSYFEAVVLMPLKTVFHVPQNAEYFGVIIPADGFIADSVSVRFALLLLAPFALYRFLAYLESAIERTINPQLKRNGVIVFYTAALIAIGLYPLILRIDYRGVSEPFSGHGAMRYTELASSFMLGFGLVVTGWYLCGLAGYIGMSSWNHFRPVWPWVASPIFGVATLLIISQTSGSPLNWAVVASLATTVASYCILGALTVKISRRMLGRCTCP